MRKWVKSRFETPFLLTNPGMSHEDIRELLWSFGEDSFFNGKARWSAGLEMSTKDGWYMHALMYVGNFSIEFSQSKLTTVRVGTWKKMWKMDSRLIGEYRYEDRTDCSFVDAMNGALEWEYQIERCTVAESDFINHGGTAFRIVDTRVKLKKSPYNRRGRDGIWRPCEYAQSHDPVMTTVKKWREIERLEDALDNA